MNERSLEWQPIDRKKIFSTRIFDIHEVTSRSPDNAEKTFLALHASDWAIVVPVIHDAQGNSAFLMVRQWRHGSEEVSIEFPGGVINQGETPADGAARELLEETGYRATKLIHAGTLSPNPAIMDNKLHVYIAEKPENTHQTNFDDDEYISLETVPVAEAFRSMGQGSYRHGLMSAALFLYMQKKGIIPGMTP